MKQRILSIFAAVASLWSAAVLTAQTIDHPVAVPIWVEGTGYPDGQMDEGETHMFSFGIWEIIDPATGVSINSDSRTYDLVTLYGGFETKMMPGKTYTFGVGNWGIASWMCRIYAPVGYMIEINGQAVDVMWGIDPSYSGTIRIIPETADFKGRAGASTSLASGKLFWQASLGTLKNGNPAGTVAIMDGATDAAWPDIFTRRAVGVRAPRSEVQIVREWGYEASGLQYNVICQVLANEVVVDIVDGIPGESYYIKFYNRETTVLTPPPGYLKPYGIVGSPYLTYTVAKNGGDTKLKITRIDYKADGTVERESETTLERSGTSPNFTWEVADWHDSGQPAPVIEQCVWGENSVGRTATITVKNGAGVVSSMATKQYLDYGWREELMSITRGTTNPLVESYDYEDNGYYRPVVYPKFKQAADGSWEAYRYDISGRIIGKFEPYGALPATPPSAANPADWDQSSGKVTTYSYIGPTSFRRVASTETRVNGTTVAKADTSYTESAAGAVNGKTLVTAARTDWVNSTSNFTTTTTYYKENEPDSLYHSQIHSVIKPDGTKQSFAYQRGDFDAATGSFSAIAGGLAVRTVIITGTSGTGDLIETIDGYDLDDIYVVDNKSIKDVSIRDGNARLRRTETHVWADDAWHLIDWMNFNYDYANRMVGTSASNGATTSIASYRGDLIVSEKDEKGITTSYTYDYAGRVDVATKAGAGVIGALSTKYTYDAEGHVLTETVGQGLTETLVTTNTYDDAGRLTAQTSPGPITTSYQYSPSTRTKTTTLPGGGTRIEIFQLDGRLISVTGTGVVPEYYTYSIDNGLSLTQVNIGSATSTRSKKIWTDGLGRTVKTERPGFSVTTQASSIEENFYDGTTGQLFKTTRTGYAPTRYEYDATGKVIRTGLDLDNNGLVLASNDRITASAEYFEKDGANVWWRRAETKVYPTDGNATAVTMSVARQRLTGFSGNRRAESQTIDAEGNVVTQTVDVNAATATTTITSTRPGVLSAQTETQLNGLAVSSTGHDGLSSTVQYDLLHRPCGTTDSRTNTTTRSYWPNTGLLRSVTDAANATTSMGYNTAGRVAWTQDAAEKITYFAYNTRGQLLRQWGGATYPVEYGYNSLGERTTMSTFRGGSGWSGETWPSAGTAGTADTTTWAYDAATGLLSTKTDADGKVTTHDYNTRGQTSSREWARFLTASPSVRVKTSYAYNSNTGELTDITYNDGAEPIPTAPVHYTYTRLGQLSSVGQATAQGGLGTRDFIYDSAAPWRLATEDLGSFYADRLITRLYESASAVGGAYGQHTIGSVKGRPKGFELGILTNVGRDLHQHYTYSNLGRFAGVNTRAMTGTAQNLIYSYQSNSPLVTGYAVSNFALSLDYEATRNLSTKVEAKWSTNSLTRFDFTYDKRAQRKSAKQSGTAFADYYTGTGYNGVYNYYNYNDRGEVQTAAMYRGDTVPASAPSVDDELPGRRFEYRYDNLGNRTSAGYTGSVAGGDDEYVTNSRNQYTSKENNTVRVLGTAAPAAAVAADDATVTKRDRSFAADLLPANLSAPAKGSLTVYAASLGGGAGGTDLIRAESRNWFIPAQTQALSYDRDGNLVGDGVWTYSYDAENRLVRMQSALPAGFGFTRLLIDFKYDYLGRRAQKRVYDLETSAELRVRRYIYDGWSLIAETDGAGTLFRTYTWGLDLVGSLDASGGVGALLQITNHSDGMRYYPSYDGNGNVAALVREDGFLATAYEYSPFGELLRHEKFDAAVADNPFRFSTKYADDESGLVYYGHRYYSSSLGRFINRDPIAEEGGINLYGFVTNDPVGRWDRLGLMETEMNVTLPPFNFVDSPYKGFDLGEMMDRNMGGGSSGSFSQSGIDMSFLQDPSRFTNQLREQANGQKKRAAVSENAGKIPDGLQAILVKYRITLAEYFQIQAALLNWMARNGRSVAPNSTAGQYGPYRDGYRFGPNNNADPQMLQQPVAGGLWGLRPAGSTSAHHVETDGAGGLKVVIAGTDLPFVYTNKIVLTGIKIHEGTHMLDALNYNNTIGNNQPAGLVLSAELNTKVVSEYKAIDAQLNYYDRYLANPVGLTSIEVQQIQYYRIHVQNYRAQFAGVPAVPLGPVPPNGR